MLLQRLRRHYSLSNAGCLLRNAGYALAVVSLILGRAKIVYASVFFQAAALIIVTVGYAADTAMKVKYEGRRVYEGMALSSLGFLMLIILLVSPYSDKSHILIIAAESVMLTFSVFFWAIQYKSMSGRKETTERIKAYIRNNPGVYVSVIFSVVFSLDSLKWIPIWDDHIYAQRILGLSKWDFTLAKLKRLAGHLSYGADLMFLPGAALRGGNGYLALRICLLIYILAASVLIYFIVSFLAPKISKTGKTLLTIACISFTPFLGMQNTDLDHCAVIILVFVIFAYYYRLDALFFIASIMLCFTKEPMVVLYAGFAFGAFVKELAESRREKSGYGPVVKRGLWLVLPAVVWFSVFITPTVMNHIGAGRAEAEIWGVSVSQNEDGTVEQKIKDSKNGFFTDREYIASKIYEIFFFNFLWVPVVFFLALLIVKHKDRERIRKCLLSFMPLIFATVGIIFISCVYHTYDEYRYVMQGSFMIAIMSLSGICMLMGSKIAGYASMSVITGLFLIQQYYMLDPLTMLKGDVYDSGRGSFIYLEKGSPLYMSPVIQINRQGFDYIMLLQKILAEIDYDPKTLVLVPEMKEKENVKSLRGVLYQDQIWYDPDKKRLITMPDMAKDKTEVLWGKIAYNGDVNGFIGRDRSEIDYDRVFLIEYPFTDDEGYLEGLRLQEAEVVSEREIQYNTWSATVKELNNIDILFLEKAEAGGRDQ